MKAIVCASLLCLSLPTPGAGEDPPPKTELEGRWDVKHFELNDASAKLLRLFHGLRPDEKKPERAGYLLVEGEKFMPLGNGKLRREAVGTLDAGKTPKTINLEGTDRFLKGSKFVGIYKLDGDELMLCVAEGDVRPTEFKANPGQVLIRYERVKPKK